MHNSSLDLIQVLRTPAQGTPITHASFGIIASTSPVTATVDGATITCHQISGQTLTVGQPCVILMLGIGVTPLLIQIN